MVGLRTVRFSEAVYVWQCAHDGIGLATMETTDLNDSRAVIALESRCTLALRLELVAASEMDGGGVVKARSTSRYMGCCLLSRVPTTSLAR